MALEMKPECQGCAAPLGWQDEALICSTNAVGAALAPKVTAWHAAIVAASWCRGHGGRQSRHEDHRLDRRDELAIHPHLL